MPDTIQIMAEIISAFVSNNATPAADLPNLMKAVHAVLNGTTASMAEEPAPKPVPAVPVRKSVHHDFILSLETGEKFQTLRRHLAGLNLTPDEYRAKWGLPKDYPMVARGYSERRSALAKSLGLGRKPTEPVEEAPAKARKPRSKPPVAAEMPATSPGTVQEPAEVHSANETRSDVTRPASSEAHSTPLETPVEPAEAQQEAA